MKVRLELLLLVLSVVAVTYVQSAFPQNRLKDEIVFSFNGDMVSYPVDLLRISSFGYGHSASSLLWLRFLQQTPPRKVEPDQLSWIYYDLDAVTELDPGFIPAYEQGGIFLSVVTEDKRGAERIFLKGIGRYPDRWRLRAYLAYHYRWELNEPEKAGEQYIAAAHIPGAPSLVMISAASAMAKKGGAESGIALLQGLLKATDDPGARQRILDKIERLKREAK